MKNLRGTMQDKSHASYLNPKKKSLAELQNPLFQICLHLKSTKQEEKKINPLLTESTKGVPF